MTGRGGVGKTRLADQVLAVALRGFFQWDQARRAAAVLGANYPETEWYRRAYALIQRHAPQAAATPAT